MDAASVDELSTGSVTTSRWIGFRRPSVRLLSLCRALLREHLALSGQVIPPLLDLWMSEEGETTVKEGLQGIHLVVSFILEG